MLFAGMASPNIRLALMPGIEEAAMKRNAQTIEDIEKLAGKKLINNALNEWATCCQVRTRKHKTTPEWADPALAKCHRDLRLNIFGGTLDDEKGSTGAWELLAKLGLIFRDVEIHKNRRRALMRARMGGGRDV